MATQASGGDAMEALSETTVEGDTIQDDTGCEKANTDLNPVSGKLLDDNCNLSPMSSLNLESYKKELFVHFDDCTLRKRISRLRDEWIEENMSPRRTVVNRTGSEWSNLDQDESMCLGFQTQGSVADSGITDTRLDASHDMMTEPAYSSSTLEVSGSSAQDGGFEEMVQSIQSEAEITQHIVDNMASTRTMRRRREEYEALTMRRRSKKARDSLESYQSMAPEASEWGNLFDQMISHMQGNPTTPDNASSNKDTDSMTGVKGAPRSVSDYFKGEVESPPLRYDDHQYKPLSRSMDEPDIVPYDEGVQQYQQLAFLNDQSFKNGSLKERICLPKPSCINNSSSLNFKELENHNPKPASCKSRSGNRKNSVTFNGVHHRSKSKNPETVRATLRGISFRRHDLSSFRIPEAPIRRTESNNDVWLELKSKDEDQLISDITLTPKPTAWDWLKRVFSRS